MAKLEDVIKLERTRVSKDQWRQLHLFKEGSFYRAYEQSAWLMSRYGSSELQAKKHKTKQSTDGSFVFVGFPVTSIDKFRPKDSTEETVDANHVILTLSDAVFPADVTVEMLAADYTRWKGEVVYTEPKAEGDDKTKTKTVEKSSIAQPSQVRLTDIMHDILAYPLESKSPIDTILFVAELKQKLSSMM